MGAPRFRLPAFLLVGLLASILIAAACAKAEEKAAPAPAPAPSEAKAPTAAPAPARPEAPAAAPKPAAPAAAPAPAATVSGQPLVPGGPPFDRVNVQKSRGWTYYEQWNPKKLALWTKAKYGGEVVATGTIVGATLNSLNVFLLSRPSSHGMLLYIDMGRCSMVGREDFSVCKGEYGRNDDMAVVPGIFQRWEQLDPTTYVFHVRPGVVWPTVPPMNRTDRTVTAADIVWFLETIKREGALADNFTLVKSFEAVDRSTVKISLREPYADMLLSLAHTSMGIFPKECYEEKDCLATKIVSPSPFLLTSNVVREKAILDKNPEFHLKGLPYVDRRTLINIIDPSAQKSAFITRKIDLFSVNAPSEMEFIRKEAPDVQVHAQLILSGSHALRLKLAGPFADIRVRRAMAMVLDLPGLWEASHEGYSLFPTLVSRHYFGAEFYMSLEQAGQWYQFNPARAKQLMAEAGYPNGFKTTLQTFTFTGPKHDMLVWVQAQWKKHLGIEAQIRSVDFAAHTAGFQEGKWEIYMWWCWNVTCWADGDATLTHFITGARNNPQGVSDPVIDELYQRQRRELDPAKRAALLWQFEQRELDQVYFVRMGLGNHFSILQPWEMNGTSHQVAYFSGHNGPSWLVMYDTNLQKAKTR